MSKNYIEELEKQNEELLKRCSDLEEVVNGSMFIVLTERWLCDDNNPVIQCNPVYYASSKETAIRWMLLNKNTFADRDIWFVITSIRIDEDETKLDDELPYKKLMRDPEILFFNIHGEPINSRQPCPTKNTSKSLKSKTKNCSTS